MRTDNIMTLAHGKWDGILAHYGFDEVVLSGKHTACPMCGGKDRFRYDNKDGKGTWYCNVCGAGNGMDLVKHALNCDFKEAAEKLRPHVCSFQSAPPNKGPNTRDKQKRLRKNVEMWKAGNKSSIHEDIMLDYMTSRGLKKVEYNTADLRIHFSLPLFDDDGKKLPNLPAMLARISTREGKLAAIHRTYIKEDGSTIKKITPPSRDWQGGAIRLFSTKDSKNLIIAEGIETAMSARAIIFRRHGILIPCWAAVSANNMEKIAVPEHITNVMVAGDDDLSFAGQKAAFTLANRLAVRDKRKVSVVLPENQGSDFNDQIRRNPNG